MEETGTINRLSPVKLVLASFLLFGNFFGNALAGGYGSFGGYGGASASSSASASASSFSNANAWQGGLQLGSGGVGAGGGFEGNPFLSNAAKGGINGVKQGIAGLVGGVLDGVHKIRENIHGGGGVGCKTNNCGNNILLRPGSVGGNSGSVSGGPSFGLGGSYAGANAGSNAYSGSTGNSGSGYGPNKNCGGSVCNNDVGNTLTQPQPVYQPSCNGPTCTANNNDVSLPQPATNNFPSGIVPAHKVYNYHTTPTRPPTAHIKPIQPGIKNFLPEHSLHYPIPRKNHKNPIKQKANNFFKSSPHEKRRHKRSSRLSSFTLYINKKPFQIETSDLTQPHSSDLEETHHASTPRYYSSENHQSCNDSECKKNNSKTSQFETEESNLQPDYSPSHEQPPKVRPSAQKPLGFAPYSEQSHQPSTSKNPSSKQYPPCYGSACTQNSSGEIPLEPDIDNFPPNQYESTPGHLSSTQNHPCSDPYCEENRTNKKPLEPKIQNIRPDTLPNHEKPLKYRSSAHQPSSYVRNNEDSRQNPSSPHYPPDYEEYYSQRNPKYPSSAHPPPCYGPACRENNHDEIPLVPEASFIQRDYSSNHKELNHQPRGDASIHEEHHYQSTSRNPSSTRRLPCNGPACRENSSDKNPLELGTSNNPPGYSTNYEEPHYPNLSSHSTSAHHPPCYGPTCRENNRDKNPYKPAYSPNHEERNHQPSDFSPNQEDQYYPSTSRNPSSTRRPPCNGPACKENNSDKNPLELGTSNNPPGHSPNNKGPNYPSPSSHPRSAQYPPCYGPTCRENNRNKNPHEPAYSPNHEERNHQPSDFSPNQEDQYYPSTSRNPSSTRRPPCNGPACKENNSDKNPLELGTSNNPPGHSPNNKGPNYPSPSSHPRSAQYPPCYGPTCRENNRDKNPYEPNFSPNHEERNHQPSDFSPSQEAHHYPGTSKDPSPARRPPCNGPACKENSSDKNPLELGTSNFPPGFTAKNIEPQHLGPRTYPSSSQNPLSHDEECNKNININPLESGTGYLAPAYPPKNSVSIIPSISTHQPPCNSPTCTSLQPWQSGTNPQAGPASWHPVFNPRPACTGPSCVGNKPANTGGSNYPSPSYSPPVYETKKHPNTDCSLPDCNPYSSTGCPGPYCDSPEYSKPGCSGPDCARKHNPKPVCSGPNCSGNPFSSTGCPGPYCDGPEYSRPCTGSKCTGGQHSSGDEPACSGPHCGGSRQPYPSYSNNYQNTDCSGSNCDGVIQVVPPKPAVYRPANSGCTDGNCQPKKPYSGPKLPVVYPQDDSDRYVWPSFQTPNNEFNKEKGSCTTGSCGGNKGSEGSSYGSSGLGSASATSSSNANAGSAGNIGTSYGGNGAGTGLGSYGNSFSNSYATASASAFASAYSSSYGR